jgi:hypothetical protein
MDVTAVLNGIRAKVAEGKACEDWELDAVIMDDAALRLESPEFTTAWFESELRQDLAAVIEAKAKEAK